MSTTDAKIAQNRVFATNLGWRPQDLGATDFSVLLLQQIAASQTELGVAVDGVFGPQSYRAFLTRKQAELMTTIAGTSDDARLAVAGAIAMIELKRAWLTDIRDARDLAVTDKDYERCRRFVDDLIRTTAGINWTWEQPFPQGNFKYCGATAAKGAAAAGVKLALRTKYYASTYRLDRFARYQQIDATANPRPSTPGPLRKIINLGATSTPADAMFGPNDHLRAGDIVMIGPAETAADYGVHVCTVESVDYASGFVTTLEGNGTGLDPYGNKQRGIVRAQRPIGIHGGSLATYHVRRALRIGLADLGD